MLRSIAIYICLLLSTYTIAQQKVGLILSGGGAAGLAHIGVLKAIEEKQIVIANISGTSMGALVGSMYASGYTIEEIEKNVLQSDFQNISNGGIQNHKTHYLKTEDEKPDFIRWNFNPKYAFEKNLPKYVVNSNGLEKELSSFLIGPELLIQQNFDSLPIPFLCTASLIQDKTYKIFNQGSLIQAVRASLSYPFYFPAFSIQDTVYFDGGLYNNFPIQASITNFSNDFYIGSNVSYNYNRPNEDDVIEQLKNMLVAKTEYSLMNKPGVIIIPETACGTFDFSNPQEQIDSGYAAAMRSFKNIEGDSIAFQEQKIKRAIFRKKSAEISEIPLPAEGRFLRAKNKEGIKPKDIPALLSEFHADPFLERYYAYSKDSSIVFEKRFKEPFELQLGGNISSKPINTGFAQLKYRNITKVPLIAHANIYFGKFYSSAQLGLQFFFYGPVRPYKLSVDYTLSQWDYFKSKATFFQESKPPFVILSEDFISTSLARSFGKSGKLEVGVKAGKRRAQYYLADEFGASDTSDNSKWQGLIPNLGVDINTLDNSIYPSKGSQFKVFAEYLIGSETYDPGNTSVTQNSILTHVNWYRINVQAKKYYKINEGFLGLGCILTLSSKYEFSNFRATQLFSYKFQPVQEMLSFYSDDFQALRYVSPVISVGIQPSVNWQVRNDFYYFQNIIPIQKGIAQSNLLGPTFPNGQPVNSLTVLYKTPFGRATISLNYFSGLPQPFSVLFNFGDIIFNKLFIN